MTIDFSNLPKIGVGMTKEKYESHITPAHLKSDSSFSIFRKVGPDLNQKLATPTSDSNSTTLA